MTDPPRLLDETDDPLIASLLSAARNQAPRQRSFKSTLMALGTASSVLGGHASAGAVGASSVAAASLTKLAVKWTMLSSLAVGSGVATVELAPIIVQHASSQVKESPGTRAPHQEPTRSTVVPTSPPENDRVVSPELERTESEAAETRLATQPERERATAAERLIREVALLDRARQALASGDFRSAQDLSNRYLTSYPHGRLEQEARYLKMQAERGLGNEHAARQDAARLLELNPTGPHARAARGIVSSEGLEGPRH